MANNGGGLVATKNRDQGSARTGWGIMTGDRQAKEAMLEVKCAWQPARALRKARWRRTTDPR